MSIGILLDALRGVSGHVRTGGAYWTGWRFARRADSGTGATFVGAARAHLWRRMALGGPELRRDGCSALAADGTGAHRVLRGYGRVLDSW